MKTDFVVVDEVADYLDAGPVDWLLDCPAQHVEVPVGGTGFEMDARLYNGITPALGRQAGFDRRQNFVVSKLELFDVVTVEVGDVDRRHAKLPKYVYT